MASPITSAMDQISTDWASIVPTERPTVRYAELTGREAQAGVTGDRRFAWGPPQRLETIGATGAAELVTWSIVAILRLSCAGRGRSALNIAAASELSELDSAVVNRAQWPAGVLDVQSRETSMEIDESSQDAILTLAYTVLVLESDVLDYQPPLVIVPAPPETRSYSIDPDPDTVIGDGAVTVGRIGLVEGDHTLTASVWCDTSLGPSATVTLSLVDSDGTSVLDLETDSTTQVTVTGDVEITEAGIYTLELVTDEALGTARVASILITMDDYSSQVATEASIDIIDPDPDTVIGDGEVEIGSVGLVAGDYSVSATAYNEVTYADPATVSVRVRSPSGTELALMSTSATTAAVVTDTFSVSTDPGVHTITATTSTALGVGVVELVIVTREVD